LKAKKLQKRSEINYVTILKLINFTQNAKLSKIPSKKHTMHRGITHSLESTQNYTSKITNKNKPEPIPA
jgi:hypothetical protein